MRAFAQSGAEHSGEASAIRDAWRVEGVRSRYAAVHALRDVDAFCEIPQKNGGRCSGNHQLLSVVRSKNEGDADVWRLHIRAWRVER